MPGFSVKGFMYHNLKSFHMEYILQDPQSSSATQNSFYIFSESEFYHYLYLSTQGQKKWLRAHLKTDFESQEDTLVWDELVFTPERAFARPLLSEEFKSLYLGGSSINIILTFLQGQRRQFREIQGREQSRPDLNPAVPVARPPAQYTGQLKNLSQQALIKTAMSYDIDIPEDLSARSARPFIEMVDLALISEHGVTPPGVTELNAQVRNDFESVRNYLDPITINRLKFQEPIDEWPTIGAVREYIYWLLTHKLPKPLPEEEQARARVGSYRYDNTPNSLNLDDNQLIIATYVINGFDEYLRTRVVIQTPSCFPLSYWEFIRDYFSDPQRNHPIDSDIHVWISNHHRNNAYSVENINEAYPRYKKVLVDTAVSMIEHIKANLRLNTILMIDEVIATASKDQLVKAFKDRVKFSGTQLGLALSNLLPKQWPSFLEEINLLSLGSWNDSESQLRFYLEMYQAIHPSFWPKLNQIPGLLCERNVQLGKLKEFDEFYEVLHYVDINAMYPLIREFKITEELATIKITAHDLISYVKLVSMHDLLEFMLSEQIQKRFFDFVPWPPYHLCSLLDYLADSLNEEQYFKFMESAIFMELIVGSGQFFRYSQYMNQAASIRFLVSKLESPAFRQQIRTIHDFIKLSEMTSPELCYQVLSSEPIIDRLRRMKISTLSLAWLVLAIPPERLSEFIEKLGWRESAPVVLEQFHILSLQFIAENEISRVNPHAFHPKFFQNDTTGLALISGRELKNLTQVIYFIYYLNEEGRKKFYALPDLQQHFDLSLATPNELTEVERILNIFPVDTLIEFLSNPLVQPYFVQYFETFYRSFVRKLDQRLTMFLDELKEPEPFMAYWRKSGSLVLLALAQTRLSGKISVLLNSKLLSTQIETQMTDPDNFKTIFILLPPDQRWSFITQHACVKAAFLSLIQLPLRTTLYQLLSDFDGTPVEEEQLHNLISGSLASSSSSYHYPALANIQSQEEAQDEKDFLEKLKDRVSKRRDVTHMSSLNTN